jgi:hypothetical protein
MFNVNAHGTLVVLFVLAVVLAVLAFVLYRLIRLAVRHGIEDARRRTERPPEPDPGWDPARR